MREPSIVVNRFPLSDAEATTLRVALCQFVTELKDAEWAKLAGEDLCALYLHHANSILKYMQAPQ